MNGQDIIRGVYRRLRGPSQAALPYQDVLQIVADVVSRLKLDLMLAPQNSTAMTSDWFVPSSTDFALSDVGLSGVLLPVRVERRSLDSTWETGGEVPTVNYEVLNTSRVGGISFYGDPLRIVFRDVLDTVSNTQYRIVYESDFVNNIGLNSVVGLPNFFRSYATLLASIEAAQIVEDDSDKWEKFLNMFFPELKLEAAEQKGQWKDYCRKFRGKSQVPKRTFWDNRRGVWTGPRFRS